MFFFFGLGFLSAPAVFISNQQIDYSFGNFRRYVAQISGTTGQSNLFVGMQYVQQVLFDQGQGVTGYTVTPNPGTGFSTIQFQGSGSYSNMRVEVTGQ